MKTIIFFRCCLKTLFYLANKSIVHSKQLFTSVLQYRCSKKIRHFPKKVSSLVVFFNVQHIFFSIWWLLMKNQFMNFMEPYLEELSSKARSMWQYQISLNNFLLEALVIIRPSSWWQQNSFYRSWNLSTKFILELHILLPLFVKGSSNKLQWMGGITSNFTKVETLFTLITTKCSLG